ncbi:hypothetical protein AX15_003666 [Amanita polypyramis BW_CC]|nr:hypothetical protein AX15_003666 [Amanita polypyramis BW_CC]
MLTVVYGKRLLTIPRRRAQRQPFVTMIDLRVPYTARVRFQTSFPPSNSIAIRSNVSSNDYQVTNGIGGKLTVGINPDHKATRTVIQLQAYASNHTLFQQTNVCVYQHDPGIGITIYVPGNLTDSQYLYFDAQLLFPKKPSPYIVPELTTYLPQFTQYFASLSNFVTFTRVSIFGTANDVVCQYLQAPEISIKNVRAAITGNFNVSKSLTLDTIQGPITSNITLTSIMDSPTVVLDTGDGPIYATISLSSARSEKSNFPIFVSRVQTFSAPIILSFKNDAPMRLPLRLYVANNGAPTNVTLDTLYQGVFDIQSKLAPVLVTGPQKLSPSQFRIMLDTQMYERLSGWVGNGSRPGVRSSTDGQVELVSALGPIALNFEYGIS